jgi:hypothetical protein
MENIIKASVNLMHAITEKYGPVDGIKLWDSIRENLPEEVSHSLLVYFLSNALTNQIELMFYHNTSGYVDAVKELRSITGCGLKEALDRVKSIESGVACTINVPSSISFSSARNSLTRVGFKIK